MKTRKFNSIKRKLYSLKPRIITSYGNSKESADEKLLQHLKNLAPVKVKKIYETEKVDPRPDVAEIWRASAIVK